MNGSGCPLCDPGLRAETVQVSVRACYRAVRDCSCLGGMACRCRGDQPAGARAAHTQSRSGQLWRCEGARPCAFRWPTPARRHLLPWHCHRGRLLLQRHTYLHGPQRPLQPDPCRHLCRTMVSELAPEDLQVFHNFLLSLLLERLLHLRRRRYGGGLPGAVSVAGPLQPLTSRAQSSPHYECHGITRWPSAVVQEHAPPKATLAIEDFWNYEVRGLR